ncbi:hypothetical protein EV702DRAFT_1044754 [Suillus placidus]|uniref:Uncharacterized protein n=1 Tax=Suillus placidus TaxID=48579 RepID=A0A9P6ZXN2_9AGAM|nr:hypothetical protein EV702DRAFT_1044754 [Suillus placidus]
MPTLILEIQNTATSIKQQNKFIAPPIPDPKDDTFEVSAGTRESNHSGLLFVIFHSRLPRTVKDHVMLYGAFNNAWLGHEVSLMQRAQLLRPIMLLPVKIAAWAFNEDTQFSAIIATHTLNAACTSRQPERCLATALATLELSLIDTAIIAERLEVPSIEKLAEAHSNTLLWTLELDAIRRRTTRYGAESRSPNSASRRTQNFTSLGSMTEGSDVATATISDEFITLPSESASTRSVSPKIATGSSHREGALKERAEANANLAAN